MKRIRMLGLCLTVVFALGALIAAGAQAEQPTVTSHNPPTPTLKTPHAGEVKCKEGANGTGEMTGPLTGKALVTFKGCETLGFACTSAGKGSGEITTLALVTVLGYLNAGHTEVGTLFAGEKEIEFEAFNPLTKKVEKFKGPGSSEFSCVGGKLKVATIGAVIGKTTGNINSATTTATTTFEGEEETFFNCVKVEAGKGTFEDPECSKPGGTKEYEVEAEKSDSQKIKKFNGEAENKVLFTHVDSEIPGKEANVILESAELTVGTATNNLKPKKPGSKKLVATNIEIKTGGATPVQGECIKAKKAKFADPACTIPAAEKNGKFKGKYEFTPGK